MISGCSPTGDGTERFCWADLFSDTAALCESVWQDKPLHLCLRVVSWLWPYAAGLTHPDVVCTRPGHRWLITPYLPWRIRALIEHGLVTDPFLCPWKAWPVLWLLPRDEWLHFGPDHAVGRPLFPWLMALGCWTASRRSLLTWSDSAGDCQGPAASAANTDSCRERGASFRNADPCLYNADHPLQQVWFRSPDYFLLQMCSWARHLILLQWWKSKSSWLTNAAHRIWFGNVQQVVGLDRDVFSGQKSDWFSAD